MAEATLQGDMVPQENAGGSAVLRMLASLPLSGRAGVLVAAIATMLALAAIIWYGTRPSFKTLFSGLPEEEAGKVVEQLTKMNVPYELAANGTTVRIPADKVHSIRLEMATQGMPKKIPGVGFEIFDQTTLVGMTDFMQHMNYQRALQGELARSIESISAVQKARVHLVLPKRSLFVSEEKQASASVVVELSRGLTPDQIDGIVHLVAAAVEGLDETNVTILDHKGSLIAGGKKKSEDGRMANDEALNFQRQVEKSLEERVQTMLDRVLGADRSIIRVTADLDMSRVNKQEEKFDPDGQVARSEQAVTESSKGAFGPSGVPGVQPNDANAQAANLESNSKQSRDVERSTTNYEISKVVSNILLPVGSIRRLSVAVLVDGLYQPEQEGGKPVYKERPEEEIARLRKIVERAVGFNNDRGDTIEVSNVPFEPIVMPVEEEKPWATREFYLEVAKYAVIGLLVLVLILFVMRPMVRKLLTPEKPHIRGGLPSTVAELERQLLAEGVGSMPAEQPAKVLIPDRSLQMSQQMIADHADEARDILRQWMTEAD